MSKSKIVVFLGDSTSMTIGLEREAYPFHLADEPRWEEGTVFINSSQPGMTSADATAFFFNDALPQYSPAAVVCYLGNCDANATELDKGRYSLVRQWSQAAGRFFGRPYKPVSLKNKLLRLEWNAQFNPHVERPESPESFEANIERILKACRARKIPVIMVNPVANFLFPAGIGKGNFIFYSFLNTPDRIADTLSIPDERFIKARRLEQQGQWLEAMRDYKVILDNTSPQIASLEYPLIVVNNYAVCAANTGRFQEAEKLWQILLLDRSARREIIHYNLACLYRSQGETLKSEEHFAKAFEIDVSLYRVKQTYRDVISRLAKEFDKTVDVVDMSPLVDSFSFVDHCHGMPSVQCRLVVLVKAAFERRAVLAGKSSACIKNVLFNPELALGNRREFFSYYKTYAPFSLEEIARQLDTLKNTPFAWELSDEDVPGVSMEVARACRYYLTHPAFPDKKDIFAVPPALPGDIGRFPELYLARYMIPFLISFEKDVGLSKRFAAYRGLWHSAEAMRAVLPSGMIEATVPLRPVSSEDLDYVRRILQCVGKFIDRHLEDGVQVHERLRTTMFWYFREVLRWGSHSRVSMRYDRRKLEYCMEALIVAAVVNDRSRGNWLPQIVQLAEQVGRITAIHEKFCSKIDLKNDDRQWLDSYGEELKRCSIKARETFSPQPITSVV